MNVYIRYSCVYNTDSDMSVHLQRNRNYILLVTMMNGCLAGDDPPVYTVDHVCGGGFRSYGVESWGWSRGVEWSGVWSGVGSTLYSCYLGRKFVVELSNESTLNTTPMIVQFRTSKGDIKYAKKTNH